MTLLMFGLIAATPSLCLILSLIGPERRPSFNAFQHPAALRGMSVFSADPGAIGCSGGFDASGGDGGSSC